MTIKALTVSELTALTQRLDTTAQLEVPAKASMSWAQDGYDSATPESPYPSYERVHIGIPETDPIRCGREAIVDEELYSDILNKYSEGGFTPASFNAMVDELWENRLITLAEKREIGIFQFSMECQARHDYEVSGKHFELSDYMTNHRFFADDLFAELMDFVENLRNNNGQRREFDFLEEFATIVKDLVSIQKDTEDGVSL